MKQQHTKRDIKTFSKGVNSDTNKEMLQSNKGEFVDARNMRTLSMDGDNFTEKKIKGEEILYPNIDNRCIGGTGLPLSDKYECLLTLDVNTNIVEVWATKHSEVVLDSFIRINGKIVLMSPNYPYDADYPLQYDSNNTCVGGEFFTTDDRTPPLILNVKDLMLNSGMTFGGVTEVCTPKYFDGYVNGDYTVGVTAELFQPAFIKQSDGSSVGSFVFGTQGLNVGRYKYSYRYVLESGERSSWSPSTVAIDGVVSDNTSSANVFHPHQGTFSAVSGVNSGRGNSIRLKYDNQSFFDFIEVRRDSWNYGSTVNSPANSGIIGKFSALEGLNVVDFFDLSGFDEYEEVLSESDLINENESPETAKSLRYYNNRLWLMNISLRSNDISKDSIIELVDENEPLIPVIEDIGQKAHASVHQCAYYPSEMRGEVNTYGIMLRDNSGVKTFVKTIKDNYRHPNRRDAVSSETLGLSYKGVSGKNTDTNGNIHRQTHEAFGHEKAVSRTWNPIVNSSDPYDPTLVNILSKQSLWGATPPINVVTSVKGFATLHPVSQTDSASHFGVGVNKYVQKDNKTNSESIGYNPKCFGLDYYSLGVGFKGLKTESVPGWADGFYVMQTKPAGRVIAQGLGFYNMTEAKDFFDENGGKRTDSLICNFPDLDPVIGINPSILTTDLSGSQGSASPYRIEVVSPLGFFSEFFNYFSTFGFSRRRALDAIAYCRIQDDSDGLINPHSNDIIKFGTWRTGSEQTAMFPNGANPNLFTINSILDNPTKIGDTFNVNLKLDQQIYTQSFTGSNGNIQDFDNLGLRKFLEPIYVLNIVKDDAKTTTSDFINYKDSSCYIKFSSKVLVSDGSVNQETILVSERWEDCIQTRSNQVYNDYSSLERFVNVRNTQYTYETYVNVTNKTQTEINVINNDILINGFSVITDSSGSTDVTGVYTSYEIDDDGHPTFYLKFENLPLDYEVFVEYDERIPVRTFIGDSYINEHTHSIIDNRYNRGADPVSDSEDFRWNIPFPYPVYEMANGFSIVGKPTGDVRNRYQTKTQWGGGHYDYPAGANLRRGKIYFDSDPQGYSHSSTVNVLPAKWRQMVAMWCAETRISLGLGYNVESLLDAPNAKQYGLVNYIPRPNKWKHSSTDELPPSNPNFFGKANVKEEYFYTYGSEHLNWGRGGFKTLGRVNIDHSKGTNVDVNTTIPTFGFREETHFCTRVIWSNKRIINLQDSPSLRTFPSINTFDIQDDTGEIKFAWSGDSSKGNNLYAITNNGLCLLLVDKRVISEINANELATVGSDINGITNELWLNKDIGMDRETWRSWAEYSNTLFFTNNSSSYMLNDNKVTDLAEGGYLDLLKREFISRLDNGVGNKLSGVFNLLNKEYITNVDNDKGHSTLIYGLTQEMLQCQSDYNFDKYLNVKNKVYGMRNNETYLLGVGNIIDGDEFECYVTAQSDADVYSDKEFVRIRVNSKSKPERIVFYDNYEDYINNSPSSTVDANANPLSIKDYFGYECYVPRKDVSPHNRQQGRNVIFKIVSKDDENFFIATVGVEYKILK